MKVSQKILVTVVTSSVRLHRWMARFQADHDVEAIHVIAAAIATSLVILTTVVCRSSATAAAASSCSRGKRNTSLAATIVLPLLVFVAHEHHRLRTVRSNYRPPDSNFYEHNNTLHSYQPRPMQELYYSNGIYRNLAGNKQVFFRGINLPAKTPSHPTLLQSTETVTDFYESHRTVSFVDRPFPLSEADEHFSRLSNLGFNLLRLSVSWEAVMHAGPGIIDADYLEYLVSLVRMASRYGLYVIIDPHQDVWSRFTGGDGAPGWTLEAAAGFRLDGSLHKAGCAFLHQHLGPDETLPTMAWPTNYGRLATATMFTLFFAGDVYAPNITVPDTGGETIQHHLRKHYAEFIKVVANALKDEVNVIGFETMNEPSNGFVGVDDLRDLVMPAPFLSAVTGFDSMRLGSGATLNIGYYSSPFVFKKWAEVNEEQSSCWQDGRDVWLRMGVFEIDETTGERRLLQPHYFRRQSEDFLERYMAPFFFDIQRVVASANSRFVTYAAPHIDVMNPTTPPVPDLLFNDEYKFGWAPHFYDAATLLLKSYSDWFALDVDYKLPIVTPTLIAKSFGRMLKSVKNTGRGIHVIVGETGIPFDLNNAKLEATVASAALDRTIRGMEANLLEYVLWNYMPYSTASKGDWWNGEDLSIRSEGRNRALDAVARPYVYAIEGTVEMLKQGFDLFDSKHQGTYHLEVSTGCKDGERKLESKLDATSSAGGTRSRSRSTFEIFVPGCHFPLSLMSITSWSENAKIEYDWPRQTIFWTVFDCKDGLTIA